MANANEDLIRSGYEAFGAGDFNAVLALLAGDITWHAGGSNQLAGDYHGPQEVMGLFGRLLELTDGTFRLDVHDVLANDARSRACDHPRRAAGADAGVPAGRHLALGGRQGHRVLDLQRGPGPARRLLRLRALMGRPLGKPGPDVRPDAARSWDQGQAAWPG